MPDLRSSQTRRLSDSHAAILVETQRLSIAEPRRNRRGGQCGPAERRTLHGIGIATKRRGDTGDPQVTAPAATVDR